MSLCDAYGVPELTSSGRTRGRSTISTDVERILTSAFPIEFKEATLGSSLGIGSQNRSTSASTLPPDPAKDEKASIASSATPGHDNGIGKWHPDGQYVELEAELCQVLKVADTSD